MRTSPRPLRNRTEVRFHSILLISDAGGMRALTAPGFFGASEFNREPVGRRAVVSRHLGCALRATDVAMRQTKRLTPAHTEATRLSRPRVWSAIRQLVFFADERA